MAEYTQIVFATDLARALYAEASEANLREDVERLEDRLAEAVGALREIAKLQPRMLATLQKHGVVFDGPLGADPKNFQHVAFSVYTTLCEADSIAQSALTALTTEPENPATP